MSKVTSKLQVTLPKAIADQYKIRPGDEIEWAPAGEAIRVVPAGKRLPSVDPGERARIFDQATDRHRKRRIRSEAQPRDRGWTREDLYGRGRTR